MSMIRNRIGSFSQYHILEGLELLRETSKTQFVESVDVAVNLGINTRKSDQNIRHSVIMPHGTGQNMRIAVFTQGNDVDLIKKEGINLVGLEDVFNYIKLKGCNNIDIVLASPDVMTIVSKLGSILGPRGLMPNPKIGTVSKDIVGSIRKIRAGQVQYRNDKNGIIHVVIGKINFDSLHLKKNLEALIASIKQVRPVSCKGTYIKKISISTTMGGSVCVEKNSLGILTF